MIIRDFGEAGNSFGCDSDKKKFGIIDCHRKIYIFVTQDEYKNKNFIKCPMAILNECVSKSSYTFSHVICHDTGIDLRRSVYFGTIYTNFPGNIQSPEAFFALDNFRSTEKTILPEEIESHGTLDYSIRFRDIDNDTILLMANNLTEVNALPPQYYTEHEMYGDLGDFADMKYENIGWKTNMTDLIDNYTVIQFMDIMKFDSMRLELYGKLVDASSKYSDSFSAPMNIGGGLNDYYGKDAVFIYDSDGKGMNKCGVNVKGGRIPYGKMINKRLLANNLENTLERFTLDCQDYEKEYGHIRVLYSPNDLGGKYKIRFKDYIKSPIKPIAAINNFGIMDETKEDSNIASSLDNKFVIDDVSVSNIESAYKAANDNFTARTQGYY